MREQAPITFTRGRPCLKNDQCFVEEKMARLCAKGPGMTAWWENAQARQLDPNLSGAEDGSVNCFKPRVLLLAKQRDGKKCALSTIQPRPRYNGCSFQESCPPRNSKN